MSDANTQLVQLIAQQVLAVMRERGLISGNTSTGAAPHTGDTPVEVHPPIGICTGDYSQFPELAGKLYGLASKLPTVQSSNPAQSSATPSTTSVTPVESIALTGIITANQLQAAMDSSPGGVAVLAHDARLSPLANDLARQFPQRVRRAAASGNSSGSTAADSGPLPWFWWIDGQCPIVAEVTGENASRLRSSTVPRDGAAVTAVVRELAGLVKSRRVAGGILFVRSSAKAVCLANRNSALRAIVGTSGDAVVQGIAEIGANVLVVEYPHHGRRSMGAMVERMLQQSPKASAAVERELGELHRM